MTFRARKNADWRCAVKSLILDVPSILRQQSVTRGGETSDMGQLASGDKGETCVRRQAENLFQPFPDCLFDDGGGRRGSIKTSVLLPGGREPIGGDGSGQCAADHPTEEPATGRSEQATLNVACQFFNYLRGRQSFLRERFVELCSQFGGISRRCH